MFYNRVGIFIACVSCKMFLLKMGLLETKRQRKLKGKCAIILNSNIDGHLHVNVSL